MSLVVQRNPSGKDFLSKNLLVRTYCCVKSLYAGHCLQHQKGEAQCFITSWHFICHWICFWTQVEAVFKLMSWNLKADLCA